MDVKKVIENTKKKEGKSDLFCSSCYSAAWIHGDNTASISEATHSIGTITVNIQIESNLDNRFSDARLEGGSSLMIIKEHEQMIKSKQKRRKEKNKRALSSHLSNDVGETQVDVTAAEYLH